MNLNDIKTFKSIIIINEIVNGRQFKTVFNGDDRILEGLLVDLMAKGYLSIQGDQYVTTKLGNDTFDAFMKRYNEYLKVFDVYSFVDLEKGEFAFAKYFDFDTDADWDKFKADQRFDDVRIAVALFKKLNPHEIVFMSFINENRFDTQSTGWQVELLSDNIWNEIDQIVSTAITPEQLGSEDVIVDIIGQGTELMIGLLKKEAERNQEIAEQKAQQQAQVASDYDDDYYEEEYVVYDPYYDSYYDPYFVPLFWTTPLFLW